MITCTLSRAKLHIFIIYIGHFNRSKMTILLRYFVTLQSHAPNAPKNAYLYPKLSGVTVILRNNPKSNTYFVKKNSNDMK